MLTRQRGYDSLLGFAAQLCRKQNADMHCQKRDVILRQPKSVDRSIEQHPDPALRKHIADIIQSSRQVACPENDPGKGNEMKCNQCLVDPFTKRIFLYTNHSSYFGAQSFRALANDLVNRMHTAP